jgi:succinate dehydrogenase/fumarate reductase flavoprotein subunit
MQEETLRLPDAGGTESEVPLLRVNTLVLGSGASGLNAAVQLRNQGVEDVLILTEGLEKGTSINTGSDKQTYYKLGMCDVDADAPRLMAETYYDGGMHGDLALAEAAGSARGFLHLVNLGVPFPRDAYGQFIGYKTDHDPRQRATSIGPYTSREMCRALIREVRRKEIPVREERVAVELLTVDEPGGPRAAGVLAMTRTGRLEACAAENVVFATGGPGGIYRTSVYPEVHTGGIGLALRAGARAQGLPLSQYGLASTTFRWNVSGTYMQVVPRFVSTEADGSGEPREFMRDSFTSVGEMNSMVFLKGYQWPFDPRKIVGGSSIVDILVYIETVERGRRVFLDFRENPEGFAFEDLSEEAREYLEKSQALLETPFARLSTMNPAAIELYRDHGIDIETEPLEIAVCAQHNNGGLAGTHWWESVNIRRLFPVGEVNGSHGVYRPGGSALNSGQVAGFRVADYIAHRPPERPLGEEALREAVGAAYRETRAYLATCDRAESSWQTEREQFQRRMTEAGAHIRSSAALRAAVEEARGQWKRIESQGCSCATAAELPEVLRNRALCLAHRVYLEAVLHDVESGTGSRGSALVLDPGGQPIHERLDKRWRYLPENPDFLDRVLETTFTGSEVENAWVDRRPIPESDTWFETAWAAYRAGAIYD